jgi:hypothetical protein
MLPNIKLNIDFTKLAKIATSKGKKMLADYLINNETSIQKKIPFLLEVRQHQKALIYSMKGGDPNIINKVITEVLKLTSHSEIIGMFAQMQEDLRHDGLRHLRNYAKNRKNYELLAEIGHVTENNIPVLLDYSQIVVQLGVATEQD